MPALLLLSALLLAVPVRSGAAESTASAVLAAPTAIAGEEVIVSAERLERNSREGRVTGEGAVTIRHREMRLVADRVVYTESTKEVVADGNIVLDSGPDRMQGSHLELNLETRVGFMEHAQGFIQTYYFTGERVEKRGADHYFLRGASYTTCEGVLPDWSFHATSTDITINEYLYAWNPTLRVKHVPVFYFPYAVFPVKRERSTGLLIPRIGFAKTDGLTLHEAFYWAPRDSFDTTLGIDYLEKTGWGANAEVRYLLAPRTQGVTSGYFQRNTHTAAERWSVTTRNSQELPFGFHAEVDAFYQSDRTFIATQGTSIETRADERTTSSFFINRNWSAWNVALAGREEVSLITEKRTTLTRFPELTIDRTSTRLFDTGLFLKIAASGVALKRDDGKTAISTDRLNLSPEMTWPLSIGTAARFIPSASYAWTYYTENTKGVPETRALPAFKLALEGPRPYRIWDLSSGGRFTKIKHLIEPSVSYVYTTDVNQDSLPQFDALDRIRPANRMEYSLINTLFAKVRTDAGGSSGVLLSPLGAPAAVAGAAPGPFPALEAADPVASLLADLSAVDGTGDPDDAAPLTRTQELLWVKLSQSYTFDKQTAPIPGESFSAVEWEARTQPMAGVELTWRGNFDVYGKGVGYQNLSVQLKPALNTSVHFDWRATRDSDQDFLDLGGTFSLWHIDLSARSRYNLAEKAFVENRIGIKYVSQCWDVTLGYVKWATDYQYILTFALKGIGTIVKI